MQQGALPSQILKSFVQNNIISSTDELKSTSIQPSSFDLTIGTEGYEVEGSILPVQGKAPLSALLKDNTFVKKSFVLGEQTLKKKHTYILKLAQSLHLPHGVSGIANPKSSAGRIDLQVRLLAHDSDEFDAVPQGYKGDLYIEVSPKSMDVTVHQGDAVNQLRLFTNIDPIGTKDLCYLYDKHGLLVDNKDRNIIREASTVHDRGLRMTVNLKDGPIVGFKLKSDAPNLDLQNVNHYDWQKFWEPIVAPDNERLKLEQDHFYILRTAEKIRVPTHLSCEMLPYDAKVGNLRTHYAGFFDPGFGFGQNGEVKGTFAVLEIRPHDENIVLIHGQPICKMVFWYNTELPDIVYDVQVKSHYQNQKLKLAKYFKQTD